MDDLRKADPRLEDLRTVASQWCAHFGPERITVAEAIKRATERGVAEYAGDADILLPDLREALMAVAGQGGVISSKRLGHWLTANTKRIVDVSPLKT